MADGSSVASQRLLKLHLTEQKRKAQQKVVGGGASGVNNSHADRLQQWLDRYAKSGRPIKVNFRKVVPQIKLGERATHYIHPYPAKLLPHIAAFFASNEILTKVGDTILDPFSGSGTVGLEAIVAGRNAIFVDPNPLARAISQAKTTLLSTRRIEAAMERVRKRFRFRRLASPPDVVNIEHWYDKRAIQCLRRLLWSIQAERNQTTKRFLLVCFSALARKVAFTDPRLTVPVRPRTGSRSKLQRALKPALVLDAYIAIVRQNLERMSSLRDLLKTNAVATIGGQDARQIGTALKAGRQLVPLIITSPPYGGAQKYVRATSLSLGWLGLIESKRLRSLEDKTIGREHFPKSIWDGELPVSLRAADRVIQRIANKHRLRACIAATYLKEMTDACRSMAKALRPRGHLVLVIGNNTIQGAPFRANHYLTRILNSLGLTTRLRLIDDIKSRGLMTKRNKTASVITREWVLVFQKAPVK